jgi:hypothetical protein
MTPLPPGLRRVTLIALVLSVLIGLSAAQGVAALFELPSASELKVDEVEPMGMFEKNPVLYREAFKAMTIAQLNAWESMRGSRGLISFALMIATSLVSISALRLLRPMGEPRELARQRLGAVTLAAAVFRTLEGAQSAAIARRAGAAFDKVMGAADVPGGWPPEFFATGYTAMSMLTSFFVGGGLVMLTLYYRSARVRAQVSALDEAAPKA